MSTGYLVYNWTRILIFIIFIFFIIKVLDYTKEMVEADLVDQNDNFFVATLRREKGDLWLVNCMKYVDITVYGESDFVKRMMGTWEKNWKNCETNY